MNKFALWVKNNDRKQLSIAKKIGISQSGLHAILRVGQMPSLRVAYEIEKYTQGAVTMYDWFDHVATDEANKNIVKNIKDRVKIV